MHICQAIISQATPSVSPSSPGAMPHVGGSQWCCLCLYQCFCEMEQQTALPRAASLPFKYSEECRRKRMTQVLLLFKWPAKGVGRRSHWLYSKNGLLLWAEGQLQKMFPADQSSQYVALQPASCFPLRQESGNGMNKSLRKELLRVWESRPGSLTSFPHIEIVPSAPVLKIWTW